MRDARAPEAPTYGTKSTALPGSGAATDGNSGKSFEDRTLHTVRGQGKPDSIISRTSIANTVHTDQYMARFTSRRLQAQSVAANTWTIGFAFLETDAGANSQLCLSVYVWRPSTNAVVGYIYDSDTALGAEWLATLDGIVTTFSGAAVTAELDDVIVVEVWRHTAAQGVATAYLQSLVYNSYVDVINTTVADPASYIETPQNLTFVADYLPAPISGVWPESCNFIGPLIDGNGNLYTILETLELNPVANINKSTDGGKTWTAIDGANQPSAAQWQDLESVWLVQEGTNVHMVRERSTAVSTALMAYFQFHTSDHATTPDTWNTTFEQLEAMPAAGLEPKDQCVALIQRTNGDLFAFYALPDVVNNDTRVGYRKKPSGGSWGAVVVVEAATGEDYGMITAVRGASDVIHIFVREHDTPITIWHRSLSTGDVLSSREQVNDTAIFIELHNIITRPVYYDDAGAEKIYVAWCNAAGILYGAFITNDGTPEPEEIISNQAVWVDPIDVASNEPVASMCIDPATKDIYIVYSESVTGDMWITVRNYKTGVWSQDKEILNDMRVQLLCINIITHSDGRKVLAILYDDANGPWYYEIAADFPAFQRNVQKPMVRAIR